MDIILASANINKIKEFSAYFKNLPITLLPMSQFGLGEIEETGVTFVENALIKAREVSAQTGLPAIADDSGLVVDALNGAPGVYSARYAVEGTDEARNAKLLHALEGVEIAKRTARYYSIIVWLENADDPAPIIVQGVWEGSILLSEQGSGGFGYDPLFYVPTHDCSAAELAMDEKNRLSHRGQAMLKLQAYFDNVKCDARG